MATTNNITSNTLVSGTSSADTITNSGSNVTIRSGAGDDTLRNYGSNVKISAGDGNDSIRNYADNVTIANAGGTLAVYNSGSALINGSGSNELISLGGYQSSVTVGGGGGNDTIIANNHSTEVFKYVGGNLLIENYNYDDTLEFVNASLNNVTTDGGNLIFNTSKGSITLKNMANHAITIKDSKGKTSTKVYGTGYLPKDVIKNYVQSAATSMLYGSNRVDEAIRAGSHFSSLQDVIDHMVSDCRKANDAKTFLKDYCGIITDTADTGAIIGWQNGGLTAKTSETILLEEGDAAYPSSTTFTIRGLEFNVPAKNTLTEKEQLVIQGLYSWWADNALKLIEETYGVTFNDQAVKISLLDDNAMSAWGHAWYEKTDYGVDINMDKTSFNADDKNGRGLDGLFAHELTHIAQYVSGIRNGMTRYMSEGMADLTDGESKYLYGLAGNADLLATYLDVNNMLSGSNVYATGYLFWRYYMKQTADVYNPNNVYTWTENAVLNGTSADELMTARGKGITLNAGAGNDTVTAYGKDELINAGVGNDVILSSSLTGGSTILADDGEDTIRNYGSSVTINSGEGNDSIKNWGSDVAINGGIGSDTIDNYVSNVTIESGKGADYVYSSSDASILAINVGDGNDSIRNQSTKATINGGADDDSIRNWGSDVTLNGGDGSDTVDNYVSKVSIEGGAGNDYVYSSADASFVAINGGEGNDSIKNWSTATTINGGADDDSIRNWGSNVTIDGGAGSDIIDNYASKMMIESGAGDDYVYSNDDTSLVAINAGSGNDTIRNGSSAVTLDGGSGDDSIRNWGLIVKINGGAGDDVIKNYGSNVTIDSGAGNDIIDTGWGKKEVIVYGDGNDLIRNFDSSDVIRIAANSISTQISGSDYIIDVYGRNTGSITLEGAARNVTSANIVFTRQNGTGVINNNKNGVTVKGSSGADSIVSSGAQVTIVPGAGNDTITGSKNADVILVSPTDGKDLVTNFGVGDTLRAASGTLKTGVSGSNYLATISGNGSTAVVTLKGAASNVLSVKGSNAVLTSGKRIASTSNATMLSGSSYADLIIASGKSVTINAGKGNDTILGSKNADVILVSPTDGKDLVTNFGVGDTLRAASGTLKTGVSGSNYLATISGNGSTAVVTLKGAASNVLSVKGSNAVLTSGKRIASTGSTTMLSGSSYADLIIASGKSVTINAGKGNDTILGSKNADVILVSPTDGKDLVTNFGVGDTLRAASGTLKTGVSGSNYLATIS
ncbi:MAG: hypothetical protein IJ668_00385, partial [Selenomonadaceae bacterium]|nr:hypothetical protein [Selenomonadaceae bacterium]